MINSYASCSSKDHTDSTIYNAQWLWLMEQKEIEEKA
jgi:hypothetical protein